MCIKNLIVGRPIKDAYIATKEFIRSKDPLIAGKIHTNFGFGVSRTLITYYRLVATSKKTL